MGPGAGRFGEALSACAAVAKNNPTAELQAKAEKLIQIIKNEAASQHVALDGPAAAAKANDEGKALMYDAKYEEARAKFKDAVALDPLGIYLFNLCTADFQVGKFGEALEACKRVAATHPAATVQTKTDKLIVRIREEAKAQHVKLD